MGGIKTVQRKHLIAFRNNGRERRKKKMEIRHCKVQREKLNPLKMEYEERLFNHPKPENGSDKIAKPYG